MAQVATLSSVGTATVILNPVCRTTSVILTVPSTGTGVGTVQIDVTLDDPSATPAPTLAWALLSSAATMSSSTIGAGGLLYTVLSPIGGVRINSSAISGGSYTMKVLQSVSA